MNSVVFPVTVTFSTPLTDGLLSESPVYVAVIPCVPGQIFGVAAAVICAEPLARGALCATRGGENPSVTLAIPVTGFEERTVTVSTTMPPSGTVRPFETPLT